MTAENISRDRWRGHAGIFSTSHIPMISATPTQLNSSKFHITNPMVIYDNEGASHQNKQVRSGCVTNATTVNAVVPKICASFCGWPLHAVLVPCHWTAIFINAILWQLYQTTSYMSSSCHFNNLKTINLHVLFSFACFILYECRTTCRGEGGPQAKYPRCAQNTAETVNPEIIEVFPVHKRLEYR